MLKETVRFIKKLLKVQENRKEVVANFHTTIIRLDDNFISSSSIFIDETLTGNIYSLKEITLSGDAGVLGNLTSRTASVSGRVNGDITAIEYVDIKSTAIITGNIRAGAISVEAGAMINGSLYVENNIEDTDLLEKVESRLAQKQLNESVAPTYILAGAAPGGRP